MLFEPSKKTTRVVVCGEVSSGKSTLLNALMRKRLLPDNLGATSRPAVYVRWQQKASVTAAFPDDTDQTIVQGDLDALRGAERIVVGCNEQHIRPYELIELPMTTAEELGDFHFETLTSADVLVWVTIASQAWRLTERSILDELAGSRPKRSIIALSRADKLRRESDRVKLMERVRTETRDYFDGWHFVHGTRDLLQASAHSQTAWEQTGAPDILAQVEDLLAREDIPPSAAAISELEDATIAKLEGHQNITGEAQIHPRSEPLSPQEIPAPSARERLEPETMVAPLRREAWKTEMGPNQAQSAVAKSRL